MAELVPLREWEDPDVRGNIIRIPYPADIEALVEKMAEKTEAAAVLPPYSQGSAVFTSRCASVARDKFATRGVACIIGVSGRTRKEVASFFRALTEEGFTNVIFPAVIGRQRVENILPFWHDDFKPEGWYHVAGGLPPSGLEGRWTWSKEEL
jgi:hypothetical protein